MTTWHPVTDELLKPLPPNTSRCIYWITLDNGEVVVFDQRADGCSYMHPGPLEALLIPPPTVGQG